MNSLQKNDDSTWTYESAIGRVKPMVESWAKRTLEVARELYVANKMLSNPGYRSDLTSCQMAQGSDEIATFQGFCEAVGVPLRTAQRWLSLYDPDKDLLLTDDQYKEEKAAELDGFFEDVRKKRLKEPGYCPSVIQLKWNRNIVVWSEAVENKFQAWLLMNGYKQIDDSLLIQPSNPIVDKYGQFGLFGFDYLDSLAQKCSSKVNTPEGAKGYYDMVTAYKPRLPKGVDANRILRIPVIVEAEIEELDSFQKKETARVLTEIIQKLALE